VESKDSRLSKKSAFPKAILARVGGLSVGMGSSGKWGGVSIKKTSSVFLQLVDTTSIIKKQTTFRSIFN
jgi:hypothetical protein